LPSAGEEAVTFRGYKGLCPPDPHLLMVKSWPYAK